MLAKTPRSLLIGQKKPVPPRKLPRHRRVAIRDALAELARTIEPTPLSAEAPFRYALRIALIFDGWSWGQADAEAALLVNAAFQLAGVKRPTWKQGQPEWTQDGVIPRERERCARCARLLPEGNYKFCGNVCAKAAAADRARRQDREERLAKEKVWRAAWVRRQPPRVCENCGASFRPKSPGQRAIFCSRDCAADSARRFARRDVPGVSEGL
jgi:hypothetical protein